MKIASLILTLALAGFAIAEVPPLNTPAGQRFIAARQKCVEEVYRMYPQLNDARSSLRIEMERLYAEYGKINHQILTQEQAPLLIAREAISNLEERRLADVRAKQRQRVIIAASEARRRAEVQRQAAVSQLPGSPFRAHVSSDNPLDVLAHMPGSAGDVARRKLQNPPLLHEMPAETAARVELLELRDRLRAEGTLTPEIELEITRQLAATAAAFAAQRQRQKEEIVSQDAADDLTDQIEQLERTIQQLQRGGR